MASKAGRRQPPESGSWRPTDAELGSIIENRLDEAYILSWPAPLEIWVPLHDTGGYDRARAPVGSYDFRLDQIKGTTSLHSGNQVQLSFSTAGFIRPGISKIEKVCKRARRGHQDLWTFVANRSGHARDAAAKYQIGLHELAGSCGWSVLPSGAG
jgi:hypothetical protein